MATSFKVSGTWKNCSNVNVKVSGNWKACNTVFQKVAGTWKKVYETSISITQSGTQTDYDLYTAAGSPAGVVNVVLTVNGTLRSTSTATAALIVSGFTVGSTITIINNGVIEGKGGAGGGGAGFVPGAAGGPAISVTIPVTIQNNGSILGGGGGGGHGANRNTSNPFVPSAGGGGGGGGGRGNDSSNSTAGLRRSTPGVILGTPGSAGTSAGAGGGGSGGTAPGGLTGGPGGTGGTWGTAGAPGNGGSGGALPGGPPHAASPGGAAGKSVNLNGASAPVTNGPVGVVAGPAS